MKKVSFLDLFLFLNFKTSRTITMVRLTKKAKKGRNKEQTFGFLINSAYLCLSN